MSLSVGTFSSSDRRFDVGKYMWFHVSVQRRFAVGHPALILRRSASFCSRGQFVESTLRPFCFCKILLFNGIQPSDTRAAASHTGPVVTSGGFSPFYALRFHISATTNLPWAEGNECFSFIPSAFGGILRRLSFRGEMCGSQRDSMPSWFVFMEDYILREKEENLPPQTWNDGALGHLSLCCGEEWKRKSTCLFSRKLFGRSAWLLSRLVTQHKLSQKWREKTSNVSLSQTSAHFAFFFSGRRWYECLQPCLIWAEAWSVTSDASGKFHASWVDYDTLGSWTQTCQRPHVPHRRETPRRVVILCFFVVVCVTL